MEDFADNIYAGLSEIIQYPRIGGTGWTLADLFGDYGGSAKRSPRNINDIDEWFNADRFGSIPFQSDIVEQVLEDRLYGGGGILGKYGFYSQRLNELSNSEKPSQHRLQR